MIWRPVGGGVWVDSTLSLTLSLTDWLNWQRTSVDSSCSTILLVLCPVSSQVCGRIRINKSLTQRFSQQLRLIAKTCEIFIWTIFHFPDSLSFHVLRQLLTLHWLAVNAGNQLTIADLTPFRLVKECRTRIFYLEPYKVVVLTCKFNMSITRATILANKKIFPCWFPIPLLVNRTFSLILCLHPMIFLTFVAGVGDRCRAWMNVNLLLNDSGSKLAKWEYLHIHWNCKPTPSYCSLKLLVAPYGCLILLLPPP